MSILSEYLCVGVRLQRKKKDDYHIFIEVYFL